MSNDSYDIFQSPLSRRYCSEEMLKIFSERNRILTWRKLWIALAWAQNKLGLNVTSEQISEMEAQIANIDFDLAHEKERQIRHDVMAHIHAFGSVCPKAAPIIHWGATSSYVTDNADIIIMKEALKLIKRHMINVLSGLKDFALNYKNLPTLGYTHFQPAQITTVGKRATLWMYDLLLDIQELEHVDENLKLRGAKGVIGTQDVYSQMFNGDADKVNKMEQLICEYLGFQDDKVVPVSGQTYTRKQDFKVLSALSEIAQSAAKFSNDVRLLQHNKELEEPFGESQVGSSAMPYKRNPMRCERIAALSRYVINLLSNSAFTTASQWFERTLDDSANRRLAISESFLTTEAILIIYRNVSKNMVVYDKVIEKHIQRELPFMATLRILSEGVRAGGDRQKLHEAIRRHSQSASDRVKLAGGDNDLLERIAQDPDFPLTRDEICKVASPVEFIGLAPKQTEDFINLHINPVLEKNRELIEDDSIELKV